MRPLKIPFLFLLLCTLIWWLGFAWWRLVGDKSILFTINHHYNNTLDIIFAFFSFWGRGDTILVICLFSFLIPYLRTKVYFFYLISYGLISSICTWQLKIYFNINRPLLQYPGQIHRVEWLSQAYTNSFPSGHTLGAFSFFSFVLMAFRIQNKWLQFIALFLSIQCGISRIYLGQHFMSDVLFGAALGLLIGSVIGFFAQIHFRKNNLYPFMM
jgi:membrane-associated phospholipid phosphatase